MLLPMPMDMPFLLRFALEGLASMDTAHCRQILVIPDGNGEDGGAALRDVVSEFTDPRIQFVEIGPKDRLVSRKLGVSGSHWMTIVKGASCATAQYIFLHDSDSFFLDAEFLEQQYRQCVEGGLYTLGVESRWDPSFTEIGYSLPGTWELMFSNRWIRSRLPGNAKAMLHQTPHGPIMFDTLLYAQYLDFKSGKIRVAEGANRIVHFSATIITYREFRRRTGKCVADMLFRILFLALLETVVPAQKGRLLPAVEELAKGLTDASRPVHYRVEGIDQDYAEFRGMIDQLCGAPIIKGARADRLRELLVPFDTHFAAALENAKSGERVAKLREHGLG
ncbi:MAG: hypothetical protein K1Y02_00385 [Candidatus Hydrogenedentes bacterium]|nr:hypothetical protein [Candidatus Hydrogenedentota bacterium]